MAVRENKVSARNSRRKRFSLFFPQRTTYRIYPSAPRLSAILAAERFAGLATPVATTSHHLIICHLILDSLTL
jgi:hypothetical protein